mmetsp:Transcript_116120/g.369486  ORF Transcript_116120/g.369486 Transcript_116120/m.369486 type:complete len:283 (-) Transcript_116120:541-1389(-)
MLATSAVVAASMRESSSLPTLPAPPPHPLNKEVVAGALPAWEALANCVAKSLLSSATSCTLSNTFPTSPRASCSSALCCARVASNSRARYSSSRARASAARTAAVTPASRSERSRAKRWSSRRIATRISTSATAAATAPLGDEAFGVGPAAVGVGPAVERGEEGSVKSSRRALSLSSCSVSPRASKRWSSKRPAASARWEFSTAVSSCPLRVSEVVTMRARSSSSKRDIRLRNSRASSSAAPSPTEPLPGATPPRRMVRTEASQDTFVRRSTSSLRKASTSC